MRRASHVARTILAVSAIAAAACNPSAPHAPEARADDDHVSVPAAPKQAPPDGMTVIAPLSLRLRLPEGVTVDEVQPHPAHDPPFFRLRFPGAGFVMLRAHDESEWGDPVPDTRKIAYAPPAKYAQNKQVVLDEPDALIYTADDPLMLGHHCTVSACSRTTPPYCVDSASGGTVHGEVHKLSDEQCHQVVALVRSLEVVR